MTEKKAIKLIEKILNTTDVIEAGIFISVLSNEYINFYNIPEKDFMKSLKNSLKILNEEEKNEEI